MAAWGGPLRAFVICLLSVMLVSAQVDDASSGSNENTGLPIADPNAVRGRGVAPYLITNNTGNIKVWPVSNAIALLHGFPRLASMLLKGASNWADRHLIWDLTTWWEKPIKNCELLLTPCAQSPLVSVAGACPLLRTLSSCFWITKYGLYNLH
jgi:hypothetical protein